MNKVCIVLPLVILSGCASIQETSQKIGNKIGIENETTASVTGGAVIGCGVGSVIGYVSGAGIGRGCATGAVVVGGVSGITLYQNQLAEAKKVKEELEAENTNLIVQLYTQKKTIAEKNEQLEALQKMEITFKDEPKPTKAKPPIKKPIKKSSSSATIASKTVETSIASQAKAKITMDTALEKTIKVAKANNPNAKVKVYGTEDDIKNLQTKLKSTKSYDVSDIDIEYIVSNDKKKIECLT